MGTTCRQLQRRRKPKKPKKPGKRMIYLAHDDSNTLLRPVTTLVHTQVRTRSGPNPPYETVESIGQWIANPNFICMIDDLAGEVVPAGYHTIAGFYIATAGDPESPVEEMQGPHVIVVWWLPRATWAENNMELLIPVFAAACREVMSQHPGSDKWPIYGDYLGVGATPAERRTSSLGMVTAWQSFWNNPASPVGPFAELSENPANPAQCRIIGTVGKVAEFATWLAAERRRS